jgi:tRNA(fMet)-specific endonuclease VapC
LRFLLDTDTCSKGSTTVFKRFLQYGGRLHISTVTLGELATWASRARAPSDRLQDVQDLLKLVLVHDVTQEVAWKFGEVQAILLDSGVPAPDLDLINAATALVHKFTMVTHNTRDYAAIPGLTLLDWLIP